MSTPCGWHVTTCGCGSCWDSYTPTVRQTAESLATHIMWAATGRRYGLCTVVVQPCPRPALLREYQTYPVTAPDYGTAYISGGTWHNSCNGADTEAGCCSGCEVELEGPTSKAGITEVLINGVALADSSYTVHNGHILIRTDGSCWPTCVNYSNQSPAAFQVEYLKGEPIPAAVQAATNRLACEFAKACAGAACALPQKLRSLTRQGVEVTVDELPARPGEIRTGITEVDMVIVAENPRGRQYRSVVLSPDMGPARFVS